MKTIWMFADISCCCLALHKLKHLSFQHTIFDWIDDDKEIKIFST